MLDLDLQINNGTDLSEFDKPRIQWRIDGESLGNIISEDGKQLSIGGTLGQVTVVVTAKSMNEMLASLNVKITAKEGSVLQVINMIKPPNKLHYIEGQRFDSTGLIVEADFDSFKAIVTDITFDITRELVRTDNQIVVTYNHNNISRFLTIPISVAPRTLDHIKITKLPKTNYVEGQSFDSTGLEVTAYFDFMSAIVTDWELVDVPVSLSPAIAEIIVRYSESGITKTASFAITVSPRTLKNISVNYENVRLQYTQGDRFDPTGLVVTAVFDYMECILNLGEFDIVDLDSMLLTGVDHKHISYTENGLTVHAQIPITVFEPYTEMRTITFVSMNARDVSLAWRYEFLENDGQEITVDNISDDFEVPFGAWVTLTAHNPAIMEIWIDGVLFQLNANQRTVTFQLLSSSDIKIEFEQPSSNTTIRFFGENGTILILNFLSGQTQFTQIQLDRIHAFFFESSPNFNNVYSMNGSEYSFAELAAQVFYADAEITVKQQ